MLETITTYPLLVFLSAVNILIQLEIWLIAYCLNTVIANTVQASIKQTPPIGVIIPN
jgi:NADH:ubiquinone oxidoreductase subunit K